MTDKTADKPLTKAALKSVAAELHVEGRTTMDAPALAEAIVEAVQPVISPPPVEAPAAYTPPAGFGDQAATPSPTADFPEQPLPGMLPR